MLHCSSVQAMFRLTFCPLLNGVALQLDAVVERARPMPKYKRAARDHTPPENLVSVSLCFVGGVPCHTCLYPPLGLDFYQMMLFSTWFIMVFLPIHYYQELFQL